MIGRIALKTAEFAAACLIVSCGYAAVEMAMAMGWTRLRRGDG